MSGMLVTLVSVLLLATVAAACFAGTHAEPHTPSVIPIIALVFILKNTGLSLDATKWGCGAVLGAWNI
ncbi:hypothetical protein G3O06_32035 [Burkholderia sp. Ac-20345]|uniref:hypothetical protein n=1 Tax=Burkholderia sp. Ac-20345 TaxID=2703891 RepID=UPI00197BB279|nr:hypothetical protein [Burkholderia sp. Ac-20345]MBN3782136.1 hypothetical protein [Burkholderia sp. Ac-20345]